MYRKEYHIHFVGIGGIGMSGIAELLLNLNYKVSGSDIKESDITENLKQSGGIIFKGHAADHIKGADAVVISSAIGPENPEVKAAQKASVPVVPRAEMLAELMRLKYSIAIGGAHGKTTTTSIVAAVVAEGGLDPTVVIGGKLKSLNTNARLGQGDYIIAEADESDGSFLKYSPSMAVVTNIDEEHLDHYKDMADIKAAFLNFIDRIPFYGLAILCLDNEPIQDLMPQIKKRTTTYGMNSQADIQARDIVFDGLKSRFKVYQHGDKLGSLTLNLPGIHNVSNALASIAVGLELEMPFATIKRALEKVEGVQRRLEIKGIIKGITIVDDYGHHPTEIKTTLSAVKESWPDRQIAVVFQPHRFTRTKALFSEFSRAFYQSDRLIVLPIYSAGEKEIEGVDSFQLSEEIRAHGHKNVAFLESFNAAVTDLVETLAPDTILVTFGAGDVWKVGEQVLDQLRNDAEEISP